MSSCREILLHCKLFSCPWPQPFLSRLYFTCVRPSAPASKWPWSRRRSRIFSTLCYSQRWACDLRAARVIGDDITVAQIENVFLKIQASQPHLLPLAAVQETPKFCDAHLFAHGKGLSCSCLLFLVFLQLLQFWLCAGLPCPSIRCTACSRTKPAATTCSACWRLSLLFRSLFASFTRTC